jgi:6-pyruvoyltetrahydropterin/6-carboxytetrahydropterin synthase
MSKFYVTRRTTFDSAHDLPGYPGKCRSLHGHRYELEVTWSGIKNEETGLSLDLNQAKEALERVKEIFDHKYLNGIKGLEMPTVENLILYIYYLLLLQEVGWVEYISICEGENTRITLYREDLQERGGVDDPE